MNSNIKKIFITNYVLSLTERTRIEKKGRKYGFDWIIYNLGLLKDWEPIRLPFFVGTDEKQFKTKTEAEFGIDFAFLNNKSKELIIFVLKDEKLKNETWIKMGFDSDLKMAAYPDLTGLKVQKVKIILAYNKLEDKNGIELFNRLVNSMPTHLKDSIELKFERWNLSKIVEEISKNLLTPDLLPQHLSGVLNYICSQFSDFEYGSEEWNKQLIPNWKKFLDELVSDKVDERRLNLIPVSLIILFNYKKDTPASSTGWIDLIEWAILSIWNKYRGTKIKKIRKIIWKIWIEFYLRELELFLIENEKVVKTEHGFHSSFKLGNMSYLNDVILVYWYVSRIGILSLGIQDLLPKDEISKNEIFEKTINTSLSWIEQCLNKNPAAYRPLIDLHHIELFIIWLIFYQANRKDLIYDWLATLENRLMVRRTSSTQIPFIEGRNRLDLVAESVALGTKPYDFIDDSSYLLLMLIELAYSLDIEGTNMLISKYYNHLVRGLGDDGKKFVKNENGKIELQSWIPPDNWHVRIFSESVTDGIAVTTGDFLQFDSKTGEENLINSIENFVKNSIKKFPNKIMFDVPLSVYLLGCIKNKSPLPPVFWRRSIFSKFYDDAEKKDWKS